MKQETTTKNCLCCDKPLKGRSDKKFCDDYCRAAYNNQLKQIVNLEVREINNALQKNRRVLQKLLPEGIETISIHREKMLQSGFLFNYITQLYTNKAGKTYYYCYDHGYLPLNNDCYLLVRKKEE